MRTMNPVHESTSCAVAACAEIIGAKWTALLVHDLSEVGAGGGGWREDHLQFENAVGI